MNGYDIVKQYDYDITDWFDGKYKDSRKIDDNHPGEYNFQITLQYLTLKNKLKTAIWQFCTCRELIKAATENINVEPKHILNNLRVIINSLSEQKKFVFGVLRATSLYTVDDEPLLKALNYNDKKIKERIQRLYVQLIPEFLDYAGLTPYVDLLKAEGKDFYIDTTNFFSNDRYEFEDQYDKSEYYRVNSLRYFDYIRDIMKKHGIKYKPNIEAITRYENMKNASIQKEKDQKKANKEWLRDQKYEEIESYVKDGFLKHVNTSVVNDTLFDKIVDFLYKQDETIFFVILATRCYTNTPMYCFVRDVFEGEVKYSTSLLHARIFTWKNLDKAREYVKRVQTENPEWKVGIVEAEIPDYRAIQQKNAQKYHLTYSQIPEDEWIKLINDRADYVKDFMEDTFKNYKEYTEYGNSSIKDPDGFVILKETSVRNIQTDFLYPTAKPYYIIGFFGDYNIPTVLDYEVCITSKQVISDARSKLIKMGFYMRTASASRKYSLLGGSHDQELYRVRTTESVKNMIHFETKGLAEFKAKELLARLDEDHRNNVTYRIIKVEA